WHPGCGAGAASAAAGVDRCAGAALRLLPERDDDPGRRSARDDEEPVGGSDQDGDERPPVPLRDLSAHLDRDPEGRGCHGEGRCIEMTGLIHEKDFSRKSFLRGGAVVFGSAAIGASLAGKAAAAIDPLSNPGIPADPNEFSSYGPFDTTQMDSWFVVHPDNSISVKLGKVELGQGATTGLAMIVAEELDHDISLIRLVPNDTDVTPNSGATVGSQTIQNTGKAYRAAAAFFRQTLLSLASAKLGVPAASLTITKGVISGGSGKTSAGELLGGKLINAQAPATYNLAGGAYTPPGPGLTAGSYATHGAG